MNSYDLSRAWFDFCFENPDKIKPNHTALYFFAIEHCNRLGWKEKFGFPTTMAMEALGIKSYNTYINTLKELVEWGFITMVQKSKNQFSANIIALSNNNKALNKALDKALIKHGTKQHESTEQSIDSVDKQETKNKEQLNKEQSFSFEIKSCYVKCLEYFPEHLHPKHPYEWLSTIEMLVRIEKIPCDKIIEIVKGIRNDDFWSKNFLSITKLRKKNKDGIKYIVVFNENLKSKPNGNKKNGGGFTDEEILEAVRQQNNDN